MDQLPGTPQPAPHTAVRVALPTVLDLAVLLGAAANAAASLDRFIQLHDPNDADVEALLELQRALALFHYRAPAQ